MYRAHILLAAWLVCWIPAGVGAQAVEKDVIAVVERYHLALAEGDSATARGLLADDAFVLEGGHAETLAEYVGHHLGADMEFASRMSSQREILSAEVLTDAAWVASSSYMEGEIDGKPLALRGAELMVMSRVDGKWKIRGIHWSSRRIQD